MSSDSLVELIKLVDELEASVAPYLTLERVRTLPIADDAVAAAIEDSVLLVDYRQDVDGNQVTLCRLNRHHPQVRACSTW